MFVMRGVSMFYEILRKNRCGFWVLPKVPESTPVFLYCFCNYLLLSIFLRLKLIPAVAATVKFLSHGCFNREREPFSSTNSVQFSRKMTISCINPGISYKNHPDFSRIAIMSISLCIGLAALG